MSERYYCSDHHFWHENILRYGQRPFANLNEMHQALVERHNARVKPNDHVSFLGDVTIRRGGRIEKEQFCKLIRSMHGHKRLYLGNHDHWPVQVYLDAGFEKIYATWRSDERFICSHFPLHPGSLTTATANVHGHIHQAKSFDSVIFTGRELDRDRNTDRNKPRVVPYINVSVDVINYTPVHLDWILQRIKDVNNE